MLRAINSFRGEAPRVTPRALPDNAAQQAINAKLLTGDLCAWRQFATEKGLANSGPVRTIYQLNGAWLSWDEEVDVARGAIAGDDTFRTYLTAPSLYDEPQFTNYLMATTGPEPYPVATRPLGVPAPDTAPSLAVGTGSSPSISVSDAGDQLATAWTTSGTINTGTVHSEVLQDAVIGNPAPSYKLINKNNVGSGAYAYRNFGVETSATLRMTSQFNCFSNSVATEACWRIFTTAAGAGAFIKLAYPFGTGGGLYFTIGNSTEWGANGSPLEQVNIPGGIDGSGTVWYKMVIDAVQNDAGTTTITANLYNALGTVLIATASLTSTFATGGYCGMEMVTNFTTEFYTHFDNITVEASGSTTTPSTTATSYVYTFVDDLGEESAPSPASVTVLRPDGVTVTVTTPGGIPSGVSSAYGITTKRIYRAATGNAGTAFLFVAEIPLATTTYEDTLSDQDLGETLKSELWALPPDDLEGILSLPNGIMAGFRRNQICLSAQNYPHAWPVEYRLNTDTAIVGIGNIDTTVVIGTESFVYVAAGNDPAAYSMAKSEVPYACVSKKSFAYLEGIGVVFAGPDGLMAVAGLGQIRNLTDSVFTKDQWKALDPTSIHGVAHNDIYFMQWDAGSMSGCYAIDMKPTGFGVVQLAFHATAGYVDPAEDKLFLVLDRDDEPDDPLLPVPADPPHYIDGVTIYEFEGDPVRLMNFRWRGKLWLLDKPTWFSIAQVRAEDFDNLVLRVYGGGTQVDELVIVDEIEFTLAEVLESYRSAEIELIGTSTVRLVQMAESVEELG